MALQLTSASKTTATTFGISLIATSPGFKDFAHFFSSGYGAAMFAMAAASLSTTMVLPLSPSLAPTLLLSLLYMVVKC